MEGWGWGGGHVYNEDALSAALYCTLSLIGAQIRASHYHHLHSDHCTVRGGDVAAVTADPLMWPRRGKGGTAVPQLCTLQHSIGTAHIQFHVLPCYTCVWTRGDTFQAQAAWAASLRAHICLLACCWCRRTSSVALMRPSAAVTAPRHGSPSTHLL